jgi:hypothetical protein
VHSYFWLDEYSGKDDFSRYWRDEWVSGLTSWRKALKIPDSDVVIEGRCVTQKKKEKKKKVDVQKLLTSLIKIKLMLSGILVRSLVFAIAVGQKWAICVSIC